MNELRCPAHILKLFESPKTISRGRSLAIEWAEREIKNLKVGDAIWIPDPRTGELMRMVKKAQVS